MIPSLALSRRKFVKLATAVGASILSVPRSVAAGKAPERFSPDEALHELIAGNERFANGRPNNPRRTPADFRQLAEGQYPFAAIISCADSRVAPEILFDV